MSATAAQAAAAFRAPRPSQEQPGQPGVVRRQRVRVPLRLVVSPVYPDVALSTYVKVAALAARQQGCEARTATLAGYLGLSRASVERGLAALSRPGPDGLVELSTVRRTLPGGRGTSAVRRVRPLSAVEGFVWLPVAAAEDLTPRQLRAYAVIAYAQKMKIALTEAELAGHLRHYSGSRAGLPITADAAGVVVDEVEAARWVTVQRRAGAHGRHRLLAHDIAPEAAPAALTQEPEVVREGGPGVTGSSVDNGSDVTVRSVVGEGSGTPVGEGSLVYRESLTTDSPKDEGPIRSPAVGEVQVGEAVESAEPGAAATPSAGTGERCLALRADGIEQPVRTTATREGRTRNRGARQPYGGPQMVVSARVHAVLQPVHGLLARVRNDFVVRQIAREVGRQLDAGMAAERLRHRLELRYARVMSEDIRDIGRWLLGVALPRWGCGHQDCEAGTLWTTGNPCPVCAEAVADRAAQRERDRRVRQGLCPRHGTCPGPSGRCVDCDLERAKRYPAPAVARKPQGPPRGDCGGCGARVFLVDRALVDGLCPLCRELGQGPAPAVAAASATSATCAGWDGSPCERLALPTRLVCARHRAQELAAETAVTGRRSDCRPC